MKTQLLGILFLFLSGILIWKGKLPTIRALLATFGIYMAAGKAKDWLQSGLEWLVRWAAEWLDQWAGVGVSGLIGASIIALGVAFVIDIWPGSKGGTATTATAGVGVVLALLIAAFPGAASEVGNEFNNAHSVVRHVDQHAGNGGV